MNNIMVDLETMGSGTDAAIVSIGAVRFDSNGVHERFYTAVSLDSSVSAGLKIDASTVKWWLKQEDDARKEVASGGVYLKVALEAFAKFIGKNAVVWGNGSDFDNAILATAYRSTGLDQPWKFWNNRCYRTLKNLCPTAIIKREGTHHNALDDARSQAWHLIEISERMGFKL